MSKIGVYYESWSEKWVNDPSKSGLYNLDSRVTIVYLAFANPECSYVANQNSWIGTGLNFASDWKIVKDSIAALKKRNVTVMLSVGGGSYWSSTKNFKPQNCVALMNDLGCDGIDIDWEGPATKDYELTNAIQQLKPLMNGKKISFAGFGTGAYGKQSNDTYKGNAIDAMTKQGSNVDWINIMAYDGGKSFDPLGSFAAYQVYFKGPLLLGFEVGKQGWGDDLLTADDVQKNCEVVKAQGVQNGIMIWSYQKSNDNLTPSTKDVIDTASTVFKTNPQPPPYPSSYVFRCPSCTKEFKLTVS
jgi:chitinase